MIKKEFMEKWSHLKTPEERYEAAIGLFNSTRGLYLISQALFLAIEHMEEREAKLQEPSNMADMSLLTEIFPTYSLIEELKSSGVEIFEDKKDGRNNTQV